MAFFNSMHVIQKKLDFIQNMYQALSECFKQRIKVSKLHYFKKHIIAFEKFSLFLGAHEYLEILEGKIRECLFFYVLYLNLYYYRNRWVYLKITV